MARRGSTLQSSARSPMQARRRCRRPRTPQCGQTAAEGLPVTWRAPPPPAAAARSRRSARASSVWRGEAPPGRRPHVSPTRGYLTHSGRAGDRASAPTHWRHAVRAPGQEAGTESDKCDNFADDLRDVGDRRKRQLQIQGVAFVVVRAGSVYFRVVVSQK